MDAEPMMVRKPARMNEKSKMKWTNLEKNSKAVRMQTFVPMATLPTSPIKTRRAKSSNEIIPRNNNLEETDEDEDSRLLMDVEFDEETKDADETINKIRGRKQPAVSRTLDGFFLLECCHVEFPEEAVRAVAGGKNIDSVVSEDLGFFNNLIHVDFGDNNVKLESLTTLKAVQEIHLHCNGLKTIADLPKDCFRHLYFLDLSYNALIPEAIVALSTLSGLRELDLSCNALTSIPDCMHEFTRLEILSLEKNNLEYSSTFTNLCRAPKLRQLNLSCNRLYSVPKVAQEGFSSLTWLNLSSNNFSLEENLLPLTEVTSLKQVVLFDNPLTTVERQFRRNGAEETVEARQSIFNSPQVEGKMVNLVTSNPEETSSTKGKSSYSNVAIAKVVDNSIPTALEFRQSGNEILFKQHEESAGLLRPRNAHRLITDARKPGFFITDPEMDFTEADCMGELDTLPNMLLNKSHYSDPTIQRDPAILNTAVTNLRYALKNPITLDDLNEDGTIIKNFQKPTSLQLRRMKPTIPYKPMRNQHHSTYYEANLAAGVNYGAVHDMRAEETHHEFTSRTGQVLSPVQRLQVEQEQALNNVEDVLDNMMSQVDSVNQHHELQVMENENKIEGLLNMVSNVINTFEGVGLDGIDGEDEFEHDDVE